MAEEFEPFDKDKKSQIENVLIPDLDDAVLRIARMRASQAFKCTIEACHIVSNSLKYYSNVTVECEPVERCVVQGLEQYGPMDMTLIKNTSAFSKEMSSCLSELQDLKKVQQIAVSGSPGQDDGKRKFPHGRFSRIKSAHLIPGRY